LNSAMRLIQLILHEDLAFETAIIPTDLAAELAQRYLTQFGIVGARYYTNGDFYEDSATRPGGTSHSWSPTTEATFDTGVLVIGPVRSGCIWVEDED
jgi:hypothetical protein